MLHLLKLDLLRIHKGPTALMHEYSQHVLIYALDDADVLNMQIIMHTSLEHYIIAVAVRAGVRISLIRC